MRFINPPTTDLTYSDVFLVPSASEVISRFDVDLSSDDGTGTTIPLVVANMTAVTGRRMVETVARRGGIGVLPQDVPVEVIAEVTSWVKDRHPVFETPLKLQPGNTVIDALHLMYKRAHGAVLVVDGGVCVGVVTAADCEEVDRFASLESVMRPAPAPFDASLFDDNPAVALQKASSRGPARSVPPSTSRRSMRRASSA
jgi:IMP dehydrogenase